MPQIIMVVSTGRADYGLLYPLVKKIEAHNNMILQFIATGTHLSPEHGETIRLIKEDPEVPIAGTVKITMPEDTQSAVCDSISSGLKGFSKLLNKLGPDLLVVLGDRYELWSVCMAAVIHRIPIAHIHGGETTFGAIDDVIRHSVTKMSAFHFASIELYKKRIIQMGEHPGRVFAVGAIGLDNIKNMPLMTREELSAFSGVDFEKKIALMTYHPVTLDNYESSEEQIKVVLNTLFHTDLFVLMTMPNADTSGKKIYKKIKQFSEQYPKKFKLIKNLGQKAYLSAMKFGHLMVGNSSSGIIESASFKLPVVNIGDRQAGRFSPENVIHCPCVKADIEDAVKKAQSDEFRHSIRCLNSPYGDGNTASRILDILASISLHNKTKILKKGFYDIEYDSSPC